MQQIATRKHPGWFCFWLLTCSAAAVVFAASLGGCVEYRVTYDHWAQFGEKFGDPKAPLGDHPNAKPGEAKQEGWAILMETFEGNSRFRRANELVRRLIADQNLSNLWIQEAGGGKINVYLGRYKSISDSQAKADLERVRSISLGEGEVLPYKDVELVSLSGDGRGGNIDPMDLRGYSGYYTLQIGFYDSDFGGTYREAAEQAAKALREDGEQAFYYHGVHRSMITVGLFTDEDFERDGPVHIYGPRILALQEIYPNNLGNGREVIQTFRDDKKVEQRAQKSSLVRVP